MKKNLIGSLIINLPALGNIKRTIKKFEIHIITPFSKALAPSDTNIKIALGFKN